MTGKAKRTQYTLEFKLKAVRRVKEKHGGRVVRHLLK